MLLNWRIPESNINIDKDLSDSMPQFMMIKRLVQKNYVIAISGHADISTKTKPYFINIHKVYGGLLA